MSTLTSPLTTYRVAVIQYEPTFGEKEKNLHDLLMLVEEAIEQGARLIVLPEMATTGYCWATREEVAPYTEPIPGPTTERFQGLARRGDCYIALGLPEVDLTTQVYYNSMVLLGPEGVVGRYRKLHSAIAEPRWARDGDLGVPVWDTPLGRLSALICMDATYFEAPRIAALHNADVLLLPCNWMTEASPNSWWMTRAFENGLYVLVANRHGSERGVSFSGGSCVVNPDGSMQSYLTKGNGIVYGEVDLRRSREKQWSQHGRITGYPLADRQPAAYTSLVNNSYLWEPLRYHSLYGLGELPAGQLSCVGVVQMELQALAGKSGLELIQVVSGQLQTMMRDNAPAAPDVLVLPELLIPGPLPQRTERSRENIEEEIRTHYQQYAIQVPSPETEALVALANELQVSMVIGIAERVSSEGAFVYYNTILLIDPEGIYGTYRKLHLDPRDRLWASVGNLGLPVFDTPTGRIGLASGYDLLFPETMRVLANAGTDLVCAPALLDFPDPSGLMSPPVAQTFSMVTESYAPFQHLLWRIRAAEHNVYLAVANWSGVQGTIAANGNSGIFSPGVATYPWIEVVAEEDEYGLMMMTIDTREQRTGRRTTEALGYSPGDMLGSMTGELAYDIRDSIPGNVVRSKPMLRKRQPFWYIDLLKRPREE